MQETDENFTIIYNFALSQITCGRYLDANSHEVKRRVQGVCEKFRVANYGDWAKKFTETVDTFVGHPVCTSHAEHAIEWSLLTFLLEVARNPVAGLKQRLLNNSGLDLDDGPSSISEMDISRDQNPSEFGNYDDESELSVREVFFIT